MKNTEFMKQKKSVSRFFVASVVLLMLTVTACKDQLETKVFSELTPENFYKSEADFNSAVVTLYNPFTSDWGTKDTGDDVWYNALYSADSKSFWSRGKLCTDELAPVSSGSLDQFNWGASTWQGTDETTYYKIRYVARATSAIVNMTKSTAVPDLVKNKYIAQAKVLRAWLMYVLYDFFGPVNAKINPETLTSTVIDPRPTDADYLAQIEKDLLEALPDLADRYNADAANWGRVSKGVAKMLLLKFYMHTKQWPKAETVGKEIIGMGYALEPNYADVFKNERNNEVIFAIASSTAAPNYYPYEVFPADYASSLVLPNRTIPGWYGYFMPWEFYDKFEASDKRSKTTIIASYVNTKGETKDRNSGLRGAIPLKYAGIVGDGPAYTDDVVIFRLGEVYLSVAEAINEQNRTSDAYYFVNAIRARAGVSNFAGMTQSQFRDAILDERGRELYGEGARRQDLIRHGKFISDALARGKAADPWEVLFPIPVAVINQSNGIVIQNFGYK